jgi:ureidoacrylate peracid hydrolase
LIRDTWNTDVIKELRPQPEDVVLYKRRFSGFYETELDDILRRLGIRNLIFTGCTTSVCVDSTIRDAMFRDYRCLLLATARVSRLAVNFRTATMKPLS